MRKRQLKLAITIALSLSILAIAPVGCTGYLSELADNPDHQLHESGRKGDVKATFLGVTSVLLDDGKTQIMIDGFLSRQKHWLVRRVSPKIEDIPDLLAKAGAERGHCAGTSEKTPDQCSSPAEIRGLAAVIPLHAHYDHALDAPLVAARMSSFLVGDSSIRRIREASTELEGANEVEYDWRETLFVDPSGTAPSKLKPCKENTCRFGEFTVQLFPTPHVESLLTCVATGEVEPRFSFPAHLWKMKEGSTLTALITHRKRKLLIVPSTGEITNQLDRAGNADVAMLGISGLGIKSSEYREQYWSRTVSERRVRRVLPVHWDSDTHPLPEDPGGHLAPGLNLADITLRHYQKLATTSDRKVEIKFLPVLKPVDIFTGLNLM
ncbi:MAG: hypothetical protein C0606_02065 [Hyphomicrobiales bacterium]|nr:MAG: hypothetical protein C0606_02065 [Hyphomicrobiales bacterium]